MSNGEKKRSLELRIQLFKQISDLLGMPESRLFKAMAPYFEDPGKDGKEVSGALVMAKKRGHLPGKPKYSYEDFYAALENGVLDYLEEEIAKDGKEAEKQEIVRQKWETERGFIHLLIEAAYLVPGDEMPFITQIRAEYEPTKERLLSTFKTRFMELDPKTATRLKRNFEAFASLTTNDCRFVAALLGRKGEDRVELGKQLRGISCPAGAVLEQLVPEELVCWKAIRNKMDKRGTLLTTGKAWTLFRDRLTALPLERAFSVCLFLEYTLPHPDGTEPFGPQEIDLFLMFKYCLTEDAQDEVLESWA